MHICPKPEVSIIGTTVIIHLNVKKKTDVAATCEILKAVIGCPIKIFY